MALSNSVIRRYTPPTCTLEVWAQNSPLSRWMGKSVLKQIRFELCFDDPRQAEAPKQLIRGDREQLEDLCTKVTNYIQEYLQKSPSDFWVNACGGKDTSREVSEDSQLSDVQQASQPNNKFTSLNTQITPGNIHLKPSTGLTHNLFLGSLANQASTPVINLSVLQLFDLANALDEYSADVMALPNLNQEKSVLSFPKWAPVAAVMAIAAGLAPFTIQYARNQQKTQTAQKPAADTNQEDKITLQPTPSINFSASPNPSLNPPDSLLIPGINSINPQSPNPAIATKPTTPTQQLPNSTSAVKVPQAPQPKVPTAKLPPQGQPVIPQPGNSTTITSKPNNTTTIPSVKSSVAIQSNIGKNKVKLPSQTTTPSLNASASKPLGNPFDTSRSTVLNTPNTPPIPPNVSKLESGINSAPKSPPIKSQSSSSSVVSKLRQSRQGSIQATASGTLFDTSQVAEARSYFKKRWQPPNSLKSALEYSLMVGADGKIERIEPLNKAARDYVDRSGMPLVGEAFVSPNQNGKSVRIRTVLRPDGSVQTFPEDE
ncbi:MAG: DUF4335 domain-containing protein [Calothrix sp. MO_167.B12]|nr:DUF4335 domain-containing protein [Calothrix sp. MO_167.B12]